VQFRSRGEGFDRAWAHRLHRPDGLGDAGDLFDRVVYGTPNGVFATANVGRVTSADPMRRMELGGKFVF
jgi:hypothetical protein